MKKAIFLDRDGVINIDKNYVYKISDFEFIPEIFDLLKYFQDLDYLLFIITNQSGIGREYYTKEDFSKLNTWMIDEFRKENIVISQVEFCPHHPDENCMCRKPKIGMIENILKNYDIDLSISWLIGDRLSDIECARNAKIKNSIRINKHVMGIKYISKNRVECNNIKNIKEIIKI